MAWMGVSPASSLGGQDWQTGSWEALELGGGVLRHPQPESRLAVLLTRAQ